MDDGGIRWKKKANENTIAHPTIEEDERNAPEKKKPRRSTATCQTVKQAW
jgi:hypothetical protein